MDATGWAQERPTLLPRGVRGGLRQENTLERTFYHRTRGKNWLYWAMEVGDWLDQGLRFFVFNIEFPSHGIEERQSAGNVAAEMCGSKVRRDLLTPGCRQRDCGILIKR